MGSGPLHTEARPFVETRWRGCGRWSVTVTTGMPEAPPLVPEEPSTWVHPKGFEPLTL